MSTSTHDLLSFAEELCDHDKEVSWRSAASRAYYSALHQCLPLAETLPEPRYDSNPKGYHDYLIKKLTDFEDSNKELQRAIRKIGYMLLDAKRVRTEADYQMSTSFKRAQAEKVIEVAHKIFEQLQRLDSLRCPL